MANRLINRLRDTLNRPDRQRWLPYIVSGSFYRMSDVRRNTSLNDIRNKIETMRSLAQDSQIATALNYYANDATTANVNGQIIWASSQTNPDLANIINTLFKRWKVNTYARDHILELATIGNLYIPTTDMYREFSYHSSKYGVALDNNTIPDEEFDIIPSYKVPPEDIIHLWYQGKPKGYIYQPSDTSSSAVSQNTVSYPESAVIHFSLGGLLGDYSIDTINSDGETETYDIAFSEPLLSSAVTPTQTLSLLEDANLLSSLARTVKFINVDCQGAEEEEVQDILQRVKDTVEQQMSLNTSTGDAQSFMNPQSPNNLIYLAKVNGQDAISITDLNMGETTDADNNLLDYYQNKKLSVLGVPKEDLNYSSNEGIGGAGTVASQRSATYANILQRIETAYISGWTDALNKYFKARNMSGFIDKFELHMNPILTQKSTILSERRTETITQAQNFANLLRNNGVQDEKFYRDGLVEILSEVFPKIGSDAASWDISSDSEGNAAAPNGGV